MQQELPLHRGTWGGRRPGAGRPRAPHNPVPHHRREPFHRRFPCHVTLKARPGIASFRIPRVYRAIEASFAKACERGAFRLVHYSIQDDHAHLVVEAADREVLGRGMKSIAARFARAVNRALRRSGPVLKERYHLRVLKTPREIRNALAYVLLNARKHVVQRLQRRGHSLLPTTNAELDPASSARWFDGWRPGLVAKQPPGEDEGHPRAVARAHTWLLSFGWRRHGLLDPREVPGLSRR